MEKCRARIRIGNVQKYDVDVIGREMSVWVDPLLVREDVLGRADILLNELSFRDSACTQGDLILHEVIETICGLCQVEASHSTISTIAVGVADFLKQFGVELHVEGV